MMTTQELEALVTFQALHDKLQQVGTEAFEAWASGQRSTSEYSRHFLDARVNGEDATVRIRYEESNDYGESSTVDELTLQFGDLLSSRWLQETRVEALRAKAARAEQRQATLARLEELEGQVKELKEKLSEHGELRPG